MCVRRQRRCRLVRIEMTLPHRPNARVEHAMVGPFWPIGLRPLVNVQDGRPVSIRIFQHPDKLAVGFARAR